jgi:membrane protease YdiL (CAAX protease family)
LATWVMYRMEKRNLSALGFDLQRRNLLFLPLGFLLGAVTYIIGFYATVLLLGRHLRFNQQFDYRGMLWNLYWVLPAAAVQEFLVRGYCFKKMVEMRGAVTGIIVFGLIFISTHDFWNGNLIQILIYSLTLFIGHLLFATALLRSGTIYFAIGLHWGNNFANSNLFTESSSSTSLFFIDNPSLSSIGLLLYLLVFLTANSGFILLTAGIWKWKPGARAEQQPQTN